MGCVSTHDLRPLEERVEDLAEEGLNTREIAEALGIARSTATTCLAIVRPNLAADAEREAEIRKGSSDLLKALTGRDPSTPSQAPAPPVLTPPTTPEPEVRSAAEWVPKAAELATAKEVLAAAARAFDVNPKLVIGARTTTGETRAVFAAAVYTLRHRLPTKTTLDGIGRAIGRSRYRVGLILKHAVEQHNFNPAFRAVVEDLLARARPPAPPPAPCPKEAAAKLATTILEEAGAAHSVTAEQFNGRSRIRPIVRSRQAAVYALRTFQPDPISYPKLAAIFGQDHSTLVHQFSQAEALRVHDDEFRALTNGLSRRACAIEAAQRLQIQGAVS